MIRHVRIDGQTAFFDTVNDRFIELDGDQVFTDVADLTDRWTYEKGSKPDLQRLVGLMGKNYLEIIADALEVRVLWSTDEDLMEAIMINIAERLKLEGKMAIVLNRVTILSTIDDELRQTCRSLAKEWILL